MKLIARGSGSPALPWQGLQQSLAIFALPGSQSGEFGFAGKKETSPKVKGEREGGEGEPGGEEKDDMEAASYFKPREQTQLPG